MKDFFISYHRSDRAWADWIAWVLEGAGYTTTSQAGDLRPGGSAVFEWQKALGRAERTLLVLSADYLGTLYTQPEWTAAFSAVPAGKPPALGVIVRPCQLEGFLEQLRVADLLGLDERGASIILQHAVEGENAQTERAPRFKLSKKRATYPGSLPAGWCLPYSRSPYFVGRENLFDDISRSFDGGQLVAVCGPAGIGKTQIAVEYAYRHATKYKHVLWCRAADSVVLATDYANFARILLPNTKASSDEKVAIAAVRGWLAEHSNWLLVFDDLADAAALQGYLPAAPVGHAIITSRSLDWGNSVTLLKILPLSEDDATRLLLRNRRQPDKAAATAIGRALAGHPLALSIAASYIETAGITPTDFLRLMEDLISSDEDKRLAQPADAWRLMLQRILQENPTGAALLSLFAFLSPDDIPLNLLLEADQQQLPNQLASLVTDRPALEQAVSLLSHIRALSLLGEAISIHPQLQAWTRKQLGDEAKVWLEAALRMVAAGLRFDADPQTRHGFIGLLPHVLAVVGHAESQNVAPEITAELLSATGWYLYEQGEYAEAQKMSLRALALKEHNVGPVHPSVASELTSIGASQQALGDLKAARDSYERALHIYEAALGLEHPALAAVVNNLGSLLAEMGALQEAKVLFLRALGLYEKAGGKHQQVLISPLVNLAIVHRKQGDLSAALQGLEQALSIAEATFGVHHPSIATIADGLGTVLLEEGDMAGAETQYQRALSIAERSYGPSNPILATYLTNLGSVIKRRGDLAGAERHLEKALAITQSAYGPNHYRVAAVLHQLGIVLAERGDQVGAQATFERALKIHEDTLGPEHPEVATDLDSLGLVSVDRGNLEKAREYHERALKVAESTYGPEHPTTAVLLSHSGNVMQLLGDLPGARARQERALKIIEGTYGLEHPRAGEIARSLASTLQRMEEWELARLYYEKALKVTLQAHGETHAQTIGILANLADLFNSITDRTAARSYFDRAAQAILRAPAFPPRTATEIIKAFAVFLCNMGDLTNALRWVGQATIFATRSDQALLEPLRVIQNRILDAPLSLSRIRTKGYRALEAAEVTLGPLQVLIGPNGGGKTSFLDLFVLLKEAAKEKLAQGVTSRGGLPRILTRGRASALIVEVEVDLLPEGAPVPGRYLYRLELSSPTGIGHVVTAEEVIQVGTKPNDELVLFRRAANAVFFYDATSGLLKQYSTPDLNITEGEAFLRQDLPASLTSFWPAFIYKRLAVRLAGVILFPPLSIEARSPIRLPQTLRPGDFFPDPEGANLVSVLHQIRADYPTWYQQILEALRAGFPGFDRLEFESVAAGQVSMTWWENQFSEPFYVNELSAGTLRFLLLITVLLSPKPPSMILLDEPEDSLHPHLLVLLAALLKQAAGRMRIIAATHSASLIRRLEPAQVVIVDREEGRSTLSRGDSLELEDWLEDYTLDQLWEMGELGGRP